MTNQTASPGGVIPGTSLSLPNSGGGQKPSPTFSASLPASSGALPWTRAAWKDTRGRDTPLAGTTTQCRVEVASRLRTRKALWDACLQGQAPVAVAGFESGPASSPASLWGAVATAYRCLNPCPSLQVTAPRTDAGHSIQPQQMERARYPRTARVYPKGAGTEPHAPEQARRELSTQRSPRPVFR